MQTVCQLDISRNAPLTLQTEIFGNNRQRLMP